MTHGLDLIVMFFASMTAILIVGLSAKIYDILRRDWHRSRR
jgi:hypothetical protein